MVNRPEATRETRDEFLKRTDIAIQGAHGELEATQERYGRNFGKGVQLVNRRLGGDDYIYIDFPMGPSSCRSYNHPPKGRIG